MITQRVVAGLREIVDRETRALRGQVPKGVGAPKTGYGTMGTDFRRDLEGEELAVAVERYATTLAQLVVDYRDGLRELREAEESLAGRETNG